MLQIFLTFLTFAYIFTDTHTDTDTHVRPKLSRKRRNLNVIKLVSKWQTGIKKGQTSFIVFHFWDLKLVPINSALSSISENLTVFFKNISVVPVKEAKFKIWVKIFLKCPLWPIWWNQNFLQEVDQESFGWNRTSKIMILIVWLVTPPCFLPKIVQIVQRVIVFFPERWEEMSLGFDILG